MLSEDLQLALQGKEWAASGRGARIRRNAGLTQKQLGREINVATGTVSRWERGERLPRPAQAARYARLLRTLAGL